ncbi:hypothetical protein [uncultured Bacteroides sp.]|uniref:hypothetical protein n=1 Tax=uncultured Bacteroides sp. TaxID=162156 RepID=UPI002AAB0B49|nr:hypothetical protein [uncultured Bacteroides sp.]
MKKVLLMSLLVVLAINVFAYKTYCKFQYLDNQIFAKDKPCFNFGSGYNATLLDEKNKLLLFKSDIDVLNYMSKLGWNLEQGSILELNHNWGKCEFIMSKEVKTDDEIYQGLNVKFDK